MVELLLRLVVDQRAAPLRQQRDVLGEVLEHALRVLQLVVVVHTAVRRGARGVSLGHAPRRRRGVERATHVDQAPRRADINPAHADELEALLPHHLAKWKRQMTRKSSVVVCRLKANTHKKNRSGHFKYLRFFNRFHHSNI